MESTTELVVAAERPREAFSMTALLFDAERMKQVWKLAEIMSNSTITVPKHLQGKPGDCLAIILQALRWGFDPYVVAGKTFFVNSVISYESQLVNAVLQNSGEVASRPYYEWKGEGAAMECRAGFIATGEKEVTWTEWLKAGDQTTKNSPLWKTNPKQQMGYVQVRNWARLYAPGALLGIYTPEETATMQPIDMGLADEVTPTGPQRKSAAQVASEQTGEVPPPPPPPAPPINQQQERPPVPPTSAAIGSISAAQAAYLRGKLKSAGVAEQQVCDKYQVAGIELLTVESFDKIKADLLSVS
jgi:RecT family